MALRGAKGLEEETVVVAGLDDEIGAWPSSTTI
jgi:hypothetical protein